MKSITADSKIDPPILVTVYRVKYPGLETIQQYYKYKFAEPEETVKVEHCPGCGRNLQYAIHDHKCSGALLPHPIDRKLFETRGRKTAPIGVQEVNHYIVNQTHPVITSD